MRLPLAQMIESGWCAHFASISVAYDNDWAGLLTHFRLDLFMTKRHPHRAKSKAKAFLCYGCGIGWQVCYCVYMSDAALIETRKVVMVWIQRAL